MPKCPFFAFKWVLLEWAIQVRFETLSRDVFYALLVSFETYYAFGEKPYKLFWTWLKKKAFASVGKWLEHLGSGEILYVYRSKVLIVSAGPGKKNLEGMDPVFEPKT